MNITKDEARLCAIALQDVKFKWGAEEDTHEEATSLIKLIDKIANKIAEAGEDKRRLGRTSLNDFKHLIKRLKSRQ